MADIDLDAEPGEVYAAVAALDKAEFAELMTDPATRDRVIDVLVDHFAGAFDPDEAGDLEAVIHVKLWDRPGGGYDHRELIVRDGRCTANAEPQHEPRLTLKVRPEDLRGIVTGESGPRRLALRGKLRVIGDLGLAMRLTDIFRVG